MRFGARPSGSASPPRCELAFYLESHGSRGGPANPLAGPLSRGLTLPIFPSAGLTLPIFPSAGGGKGWVIHPMPYSSGAPCDWNPGAIGPSCPPPPETFKDSIKKP